ncbi:type VI secretion system tip protein TssI/VgrG [Lentisphaerota bacterium ZTH]|nr:type VI secretion system tip protein VgrG [Lentisphaerota bacterium]WET05559.1 type VI secretion system tip protein TssI/VgrG [Lentisphaerota bacterium ZTH]
MYIYTQDNRDLNIEIEGKTGKDPAGNNFVMLAEILNGSFEEISAAFDIKIKLVSPVINGPFSSAEMLGCTTTVKLKNNNSWRFFNGILTDFCFEGYYTYNNSHAISTVNNDLFMYTATLSPRLNLLKSSIKSRVFHQKTPLEIVKTVLNEWQIIFEDRLATGSRDIERHYQLEQCVQFEESDFSFISRLLESEGIYYYFEHGIGYNQHIEHKMILENTNPAANCSLNYDRAGKPVDITAFKMRERIIPGTVRLDNYDFRQSDVVFYNYDDAATNQNTAVLNSKNNMLVSDYNADFVTTARKSDVLHYRRKLSQIAAQRLICSQYCWQGVSCNRLLNAGAGFVLSGFSPGKIQGLIIRLEFQAVTTPFSTANSQVTKDLDASFSACFDAQDLSVAFRPQLKTPVPEISKTINARVITVDNIPGSFTGNSSSGFLTDLGGNPVFLNPATYSIKIMLNWRNTLSGKIPDFDSMWLNARFSELWADSCSGKFEVPRKGQEVIVTFLNGNPAQPVVIGSLYNSHVNPPLEVRQSNNLYSSLIRSAAVENVSGGALKSPEIVENRMPLPMSVYDLGKIKYRKKFSQIAVCSQVSGKFKEPSVNQAAFISDWFLPSLSPSIQKELRVQKRIQRQQSTGNSSNGRYFEGINMYSNHDLLSQAAQSQYINAGKNIKICAAGSISLQVGRSRITIKDDGINLKTTFGAPDYYCGFVSGYKGSKDSAPPKSNWNLPSFSSAVSIMPGKASMFAPYAYTIGTYETKIKTWFGTELGGRIGNTSVRGLKTDVAGGFDKDDFIKRTVEGSRDFAQEMTAAANVKNDAASSRYQEDMNIICQLINMRKYFEAVQGGINTLKALFTFKASKISLKYDSMVKSSENISSKALKNTIEGDIIAPYLDIIDEMPESVIEESIASSASLSRITVDLFEIEQESPAQNEVYAETSSSSLECVDDQASKESFAAEDAAVVVSGDAASLDNNEASLLSARQSLSSSEASLHEDSKAVVKEEQDAIIDQVVALVNKTGFLDIED